MSKTNQLPTTFAGGGRVLSLILAGTLAMGMTPAVSIAVQTAEPAQAWAEEGVLEPIASMETIASDEASNASTQLEDGDYTYSVENGEAWIWHYSGAGGDVDIPSELGGYKVTGIPGDLFHNSDTVKKVTIPEGVTNIHSAIFANSSVETVNLPSTWCGTYYFPSRVPVPANDFSSFFTNCKQLTAINVTGPNDWVCSVDGVLFNKEKTNLLAYPAKKSGDTYKIPESVASIDNHAFANAANLKGLTIPDSVTSISNNVFENASIENLTIGAGITWLRSDTFGGSLGNNANKLKHITVVPSNLNLIAENDVLYTRDKTQLLLYPGSKEGDSFEIPENVTQVDAYAFAGTQNLETLTIPSSVKIAGEGAFSGSSIQTIVLGASLDNISSSVFGPGLNKITLPEDNTAYSVKSDGALYSADGKELILYPGNNEKSDFTIPDGVVRVKDGAFFNASHIKNIIMPNSVESVGDLAFASASIKTVTLGTGLKNITGRAFGTGLEKIAISGNNPNFAVDDSGVLYNKTVTKLIACPARIANQTYTAPETVTSIGAYAICHWEPYQIEWTCAGDKITEVVFPSKILSMDDNALSEYRCHDRCNTRIIFSKGIDANSISLEKAVGNSNALFIGDDSVRKGIQDWYQEDYQDYLRYRYTPIDFAQTKPSLGNEYYTPEYTYTGDPITPSWFDFTLNDADNTAIWGYVNGQYTVSCENNVNAGQAKATITGVAPFYGSTTCTFTIEPANINNVYVQDIGQVVYDDAPCTPKPIIHYGNITLEEGKDYTLSYSDNDQPGQATIVITGKGNFTGSKSCTFDIVEIEGVDLKKANVYFSDEVIYEGAPCTPKPIVTWNGITLKEGKHYTLSYENNDSPNIWGRVKVTGIGGCTGEAWGSFEINYPESADGDFSYSVRDGYADITGYTGAGGDVVIPSTIAGYSVKTIRGDIFRDNQTVESVTIPDGIEAIYGALFANSSIKTVVFPSTLLYWDNDLFWNCPPLQEIVVPESNPYLSIVDGNLFSKDKTRLYYYLGGKLDKSYSIPYGVLYIVIICVFEPH